MENQKTRNIFMICFAIYFVCSLIFSFSYIIQLKNKNMRYVLELSKSNSSRDSVNLEFLRYRNLTLLQNEAIIISSIRTSNLSKIKLDSLDEKINEISNIRHANDISYDESLLNVKKYIESRNKK